MIDRLCPKCGVVLVVGDNLTEGCAKHHTYICKFCRQSSSKKYYKDNKEMCVVKGKIRYRKHKKRLNTNRRISYLKDTFGITEAEYAVFLQNPCKICGSDNNKVLDHCHSTNKIRGVLCRRCNLAIGMFKDNTDLIESAVRYLNENR